VNRPDNEEVQIISCASCTTNSIAPLMEVMARRIGVERAVMTTVHAYTSSQRIVDGPDNGLTRGRAGAANLVPTSTGAALATTKALPELEGRFDGLAIRAPVAVGSISDVVFVAVRATSAEEVNDVFREEAASDRYREVLGVSEDPLVSSDIIGDPRASVVDLHLTRVVDGTLVKVMSWYDNEWGFTHQMVRQAKEMLGVRASA
jgi:glyceraldehyde 3-phosphate dehydrogenase